MELINLRHGAKVRTSFSLHFKRFRWILTFDSSYQQRTERSVNKSEHENDPYILSILTNFAAYDENRSVVQSFSFEDTASLVFKRYFGKFDGLVQKLF